MSDKVGIVVPSRGLIFSRTAEEIVRNARDVPHRFFFAHKKPIPNCFNDPVMSALNDPEITHIWIVEDDMALPDGILKDMLDKDKAVVTCDYPITKNGRGSVFRDASNKVLFCGTGCILIKREVFEELKFPYFRTDTKWNVKNYGEFIRFSAVENKTKDGYGLHDITFCFELLQIGIPIHVMDTKLGQRKLISLGEVGTNNGAHNIETWKKIIKNKRLKEIQSYPAEKFGDLVSVQTEDGIMNLSEAHAKKLVEAGKATTIPKRKSYIDWGGK